MNVADIEVDVIRYKTMDDFYLETLVDSSLLDEEGYIIDPWEVLKEAKV